MRLESSICPQCKRLWRLNIVEMLREAKGKRWVCRVCQIANEADAANRQRGTSQENSGLVHEDL
ncbi:hypothetical protein WJ24_27780 [Burkholderia vietnamiensis]|nr:hypothetical protein WJ24_27780 [Burkholderia vietnamiensis]